MAEPRKVYIATRKDLDTRNKVFELVRKEFKAADCAEEAEFIILDCDDPAALKEWVSTKPNFVVPDSCYPPIILASLGGKDPTGFLQTLADSYAGEVDSLPVCQSPDELVKTLKRLLAALPFYNARNAPAVDPAKVREMTLSAVKLLMEGGIK
jgi:hypothetical protein